jgi:hypothetical protein
MSPSGSTAAAPQPDSKDKTREEYLIRREDQLLSILRDWYVSVNRSVALSYAIATIVLLVRWQLVKQVSVSGLELPLDLAEMTIAAPIGLLLTTAFTDYALVRISSVFVAIKRNADELLIVNPHQAKPVTIHDIHLFGAGTTGLILALARWPLHLLRLKNKSGLQSGEKQDTQVSGAGPASGEVLRSIYKILQWIAVFLTGSAAVLVFCIPFLVVFYSLFIGLPPAANPSPVAPGVRSTLAEAGVWLTLGLSAISVLICGFRLFLRYSIEYIQAFRDDFAALLNKYVSLLKTFADQENE